MQGKSLEVRSDLMKANLVMSGLAGAALMLTAIVAAVPAAQLDQQTCTQLKSEIVQLEGLGARENMARGAAWGKGNLDRAKLEQVKKLIEMDEAVAFRCPRPKPAPVVADPDAAAAPVPAKGKGKAVAKVKPVEPQPRAKPKVKAGESTGEAGQAGQQSSQQAQPAVQAKPRPRPPQPKPQEAP